MFFSCLSCLLVLYLTKKSKALFQGSAKVKGFYEFTMCAQRFYEQSKESRKPVIARYTRFSVLFLVQSHLWSAVKRQWFRFPDLLGTGEPFVSG